MNEKDYANLIWHLMHYIDHLLDLLDKLGAENEKLRNDKKE